MTYYGAKELAASFRTVRNNTIKIAEEIDEKDYGFRATPETRTIGQTLVHISNIPRFALGVHRDHKLYTLVGFNFMALFGPIMAEEQNTYSKAEILDRLNQGRDEFGSFLDSLTDNFLGETLQQPEGQNPATKSRFEMIMAAKEHEMHHRGQLMMMMRMTGGVPPMTRQMMERLAAMQAAQSQK